MNIFMRRTYKAALLAAACSVLSPLAAAPAFAADPPKPAVIEGESEFAEALLTDGSNRSAGSSALRVAAADPRVPKTPNFGPAIDAYAASDGQSTCDPVAKPGPVALQALLDQTYGDHTGYFTRDCGEGGRSEHKEGRALDYMLNVNNASQKAIADSILNWLLATDVHGNKHANARRLGIMYLIWNRQIWHASEASAGWQPYSGESAHTDHIHFSFSWPGARKQTTWWTAGRNNTTAGDFDGDGRAEIALYRTGNGLWNIKSVATGDQIVGSHAYGGDPSDVPVSGDFNGDGVNEIGVYRKAVGQWHVKNVRNGQQLLAQHSYGGDPSDIPVVGDFDGDGFDDFGVYRKGNGQWHVKSYRTGEQILAQHSYGGAPSDIPVVGDFNNDGFDEIGVYRQAVGQWHVKSVRNGQQLLAQHSYGGDPSDLPVVGDFDGDGYDDFGVYRKGNGQWHVKSYRTGDQLLAQHSYGGDPSDVPVAADYNGDGFSEIGVYRKSNGQWHIKNIRTGDQILAQHLYGGNPTDTPVIR
ncbi:hypothetical protein [Actinoplanes sp. DH11]|uniref:hypothetical protein n=1 Tax=Actinoplanes sp. DH11 TaxID=2857011 RepID=UPI001E44EA85|nr:hypothetical protein [Actinoplanes sp. DH11]